MKPFRYAALAVLGLTFAGCHHPAAPTASSPAPSELQARRAPNDDPITIPGVPVPGVIDQWYEFEDDAPYGPPFDLARVDAWIEGDSVVVIGVMRTLPGVWGVDWSASCSLRDLRPNRPGHYPPLEADSLLYISGEAFAPNYSNTFWLDDADLGHLIREGYGCVTLHGNTVRFTAPLDMLGFAPNSITFQGIHYGTSGREGSDRWTALIRKWQGSAVAQLEPSVLTIKRTTGDGAPERR